MDEFKFPTIRLSAEEEKKVALRAEKNLKPLERDVVSMHYGLNGKEPKSFTEIGESKGYTKAL